LLTRAGDNRVANCKCLLFTFKDCNRCRCISNGMRWACTKKACPPAVKIAVNEPGFKCVPNMPFKEDCNSCTCDASGTLARCTLMACHTNERRKRASDTKVTSTTAKVQPTSAQLPSNPTQSSDIKFPKEAQVPTQRPVAIPTPARPAFTTTTNKYTSSGTAERFVTPEELKDPNFTCTPSLSFKVECNTCWCAESGKTARFCTRIGCKTNSYPPVSQQ
jgi:Pacifastin inhibitor (LCMII)